MSIYRNGEEWFEVSEGGMPHMKDCGVLYDMFADFRESWGEEPLKPDEMSFAYHVWWDSGNKVWLKKDPSGEGFVPCHDQEKFAYWTQLEE